MKTTMIRSLAVCACVLSLSACSDMNTTQQRTLSGAAIGTGVGVAGTMMTGGCVSCGAAVGAVAGAGAGYVYDQTHRAPH
jgi:osmotically inducible lipoprotein OsmB